MLGNVGENCRPGPFSPTTPTATMHQRAISDLKQQRYLRRARALASTDPFLALDNIHRLLDAGVETAEIYHLQATLLLQLSCGTFAAVAANKALQAGGDRIPLLLLLLKCHLTAFNRKPAAQLIPRILEIDGLTADDIAEVAHAANEIHQYPLAEKLYRQLLEQEPGHSKYLINMGFALQKRGDIARAIDYFQAAIASRPDSANAYRLLANAEKQSEGRNYRALIEKALPRFEKDSEEYVTTAYALGKTCEDLKQYADAFRYYKAGAEAMRPKLPYSTQGVKTVFDITKNYFEAPSTCYKPAQPAASANSPATEGITPLFILGMPRTGSTLVDRILSGHPEVVSMGELGCFKESMKVLTGFAGGDGFHEHFYQNTARAIDYPKLGELYLNAAKPAKARGRYFIDKYPMNFMDLGLIARALPNARFIHTKRNPMDTCFSNFKQLFTLGFYHFSYNLRECAEYYLLYRELMDYWHRRLPGRILDVQYEQVVDNTEPQVRRIMEFLALDWHPNCLNFHQNKAPVDTASLSQVRQPMYRTAIGHWQNYRSQLREAVDLFSEAGIDVDECAAQ